MNINLNGKNIYTKHEKAFDFIKEKENSVVILNGYQLKEDRSLKDGDFLTIISKGKAPLEEELEQMMAARHTPGVHQILKSAVVGIAGLGGLGSNVVHMLARIGVGTLVIADFDVVEPSNLNRQQYGISHLGIYKTEAIMEQIKEINPYIKIISHCVRIHEDNVAEIFSSCSIVIEAFDDSIAKAMLVSTLLAKSSHIKIIAASGMAGYYSSNEIKTTQAMNRLYVCGDQVHEAKEFSGLMAPRVAICAGHQANMAVRLLMGLTDPDDPKEEDLLFSILI